MGEWFAYINRNGLVFSEVDSRVDLEIKQHIVSEVFRHVDLLRLLWGRSTRVVIQEASHITGSVIPLVTVGVTGISCTTIPGAPIGGSAVLGGVLRVILNNGNWTEDSD